MKGRIKFAVFAILLAQPVLGISRDHQFTEEERQAVLELKELNNEFMNYRLLYRLKNEAGVMGIVNRLDIGNEQVRIGYYRRLVRYGSRNPGKGRKRAEMVESVQFGYSWHARRGL